MTNFKPTMISDEQRQMHYDLLALMSSSPSTTPVQCLAIAAQITGQIAAICLEEGIEADTINTSIKLNLNVGAEQLTIDAKH